jgi:hypothetical protein
LNNPQLGWNQNAKAKPQSHINEYPRRHNVSISRIHITPIPKAANIHPNHRNFLYRPNVLMPKSATTGAGATVRVSRSTANPVRRGLYPPTPM